MSSKTFSHLRAEYIYIMMISFSESGNAILFSGKIDSELNDLNRGIQRNKHNRTDVAHQIWVLCYMKSFSSCAVIAI